MRDNGEFWLKFHPQQPPRPPAVGTMGTLGGRNAGVYWQKKFDRTALFSGLFEPSSWSEKSSAISLFLDALSTDLHPVSFSRAIFFHAVAFAMAGCLAFSSIIGRSPRWRDSVCTGVKYCALLDGPPARAGALRYATLDPGNGRNFFGAHGCVLSTAFWALQAAPWF